MNPRNTECAVIIPSCDAYSDAWKPFFTFFFKYWPDCPFDVILISETLEYPDTRVRTYKLGKDLGWANNMFKVLNDIKAPFFIYSLEDVYLKTKVDTSRILNYIELMKRERISCIRLTAQPGPDAPYEKDKSLGVIAKNAKYRVSTMCSLWDKQAFMRVMRPGENAWQMELDGTKRSSQMYDVYLSVYDRNPAMDTLRGTAIKKRRWMYDYVQFAKKEGVIIDTSKRAVQSKGEYMWKKLITNPVIHPFYRIGRKLGLMPKEK